MLIVMWESGPTLYRIGQFEGYSTKRKCFFKKQSSFMKMLEYLCKFVDLSCYTGMDFSKVN